MKLSIKVLVFVGILLCSMQIWAQDDAANQTMQTINEALSQGDCERAQRAYNVWKVLTESTNSSVESRIKSCVDTKKQHKIAEEQKKQQAENQNRGYVELKSAGIAVQTEDVIKTEVDFETAQSLCKQSRKGGYANWRLPSIEELSILVSNIEIIDNDSWEKYKKFGDGYTLWGRYWSSTFSRKENVTDKAGKKAGYTFYYYYWTMYVVGGTSGTGSPYEMMSILKGQCRCVRTLP